MERFIGQLSSPPSYIYSYILILYPCCGRLTAALRGPNVIKLRCSFCANAGICGWMGCALRCAEAWPPILILRVCDMQPLRVEGWGALPIHWWHFAYPRLRTCNAWRHIFLLQALQNIRLNTGLLLCAPLVPMRH